MKKHYRQENDCLNCGSELQGKYCHSCGQENLQIKESFGHMITHAVSDYFHFDHQFFHTLKPLFFSPGKLTNEYMAGRRVQYLHPVKMYIFVSLVYFVLLFSHSDNDVVNIGSGKKHAAKERANAADAVKDSTVLTMEQKKLIQSTLNRISLQHGGKTDTTEFVESISVRTNKAGKQDTTYVFNKFRVRKGKKGDLDTTYSYNGLSEFVIATTDDGSYDKYLNDQQKLPADKRDDFLERYLQKKKYAWKEKGGENGQEMINEGIKHNAPKMMFLLLPLFALMLKISFYKNKKYYVEHLIFAFHFHCFMFLFLTIWMLLKMARPNDWLGFDKFLNITGVIAVLWYLYRSLRVVYKRSVFRTITKTTGLFFSYLFALCVSLILLVIITAIFGI
ncbi:DUF3667 domain-containing protein [Mucilaginibacter calamicampi]|uniref:DUF3667 domain-containing protein n=1 Tax=Mucilaginibacter calamicampi TaxID=1302352 RepID=A0ABW2YSS6_9SPHI